MGLVGAAASPVGRSAAWIKRTVDVTVALLLLVPASPILLGVGLALWALEGRPVIFGHQRVGRGGRTFRCWKFRTMVVDAERRLAQDPALLARHRDNGFRLPTREDPRVTRMGRWLRRTYLDELPQLVNVLLGDMSLVGPRPVVREELVEFGAEATDLLRVRPGIVGPWTALGHRRPAYPERARLEVEYARSPSLAADARILAASVRAVLEGEPHR